MKAMGSFKSSMQALLSRVHLYQRMKGSRLYDAYWQVADRTILDKRRREVDFYRQLLQGFREGDLVFDVGANHGAKTDVFLRLGAKVVAVEPDDVNQEILKQRFLAYRLSKKPVTIVPKAASDKAAAETMWIDAPGSAKNTLNQKWVDTLRADESRFGQKLGFARQKKVETTTLDQLMTAHGVPFFVKIDVEGYERVVLSGMRRKVPFVSFEVNLPEFRQEGLDCVGLLAQVSADGRFNYAADCGTGLELESWLEPQSFSRVLSDCTEQSIEVFWKTTASRS
jgi:FkbM family methyltransferase